MFIILSLFLQVFLNSDGKTHFDQGLQHFAASEYQKAISLFTQAIGIEPNNINYFFRRMITYSLTNQHHLMLRDLNTIISINPVQKTAINYRAELNLKLGNLEEAEKDYQKLKSLGETVDDKISLIGEISKSIKSAEEYFKKKNYNKVIESLEIPIKNCQFSINLFEMRSKSFEAVGEISKALSDIRQISSLKPEDVDTILELSLLLYSVGDSEQSLKEVKKCLRMDPDNSKCMKHYKLTKKLEKAWTSVSDAESASDWNTCINIITTQILNANYNEETVMRAMVALCLYQSKNSETAEAAVKSCSNVLQNNPNKVPELFNRGEAHLLLGNFDQAESDFQKVKQQDPNFPNINEALKRCSKMKKQASKRDYYKILELPRSASKSDVVKAYRRLAKVWHPDKYSGDDKEMADKKFNDIADAKEVLTNPEMKKKFDNGIDPLDDTDQSSSGSHGFHGFQGGFPGGFHGGFPEGFSFHFDGFGGGGNDFFFNF